MLTEPTLGSQEDTIRSYLNMRYKLLPTLIAAGHQAAVTAFPIVARCDIYWPLSPEASSNHQYIHLNDTLVAPIWNADNGRSNENVSTRSVWVPPGTWQDACKSPTLPGVAVHDSVLSMCATGTGASMTGPKTISVSQPVERIPLWHRKGGLTVLASVQTTHPP